MTRDMELIRLILLEIQSRKDIAPKTIEISGYDDLVVARHLELLKQAGLIDGIQSTPISVPYSIIMVKDLTWTGHDFISALENETVWKKIKQTYSPSELATMPLAAIKTVGLGLLTEWAKSKIGL